MIVLKSIEKTYGVGKHRRKVLDGIEAQFEPGRHYVILGARGAGKTTLLRIIAGIARPSRGNVQRRGTISLPLGSAAGYALGKTARELVVFLANLYEVEPKEVVAFITSFADLQASIDLPVASMSPSRRALLSYAIGYAIPCDFYLFDDSVTFGSESIRKAFLRAFDARRLSSATILATRNIRDVGNFGEIGCLLHDGHLHTFGSVEEAVRVYQRLELAALDPGRAYAQALIGTRGPQSAHEYLKSHLRENDGDVGAHEMLASLSVRLGASSDAATSSREALKQGSTSVDMHLIQAKVAESNGRFPEGIERASVVLQRVPNHREARVIVARCQEALGSFEDAAKIWLSLSEEPLALRAFIRGGNWKAVLESTRRSLETKPRESRLLITQARALLEVADWEGLVRGIEELAEIQPEEALNIVYRLVRSENWSAVREVLPRLRRFDLSVFRGTRTADLVVRMIGRGSAAEYAAGRHIEAQQLMDIVVLIDPDRPVAPPRGRASSEFPMGERGPAPPALGTAEEIVLELYRLKVGRGSVEPVQFNERNRAAWVAAKALVGEADGAAPAPEAKNSASDPKE